MRATRHTVIDAPRSTWIHCGSLNALDQRVPVLPSTALAAGVPAFSVDDAVAGRFRAALAMPHVAAPISPYTWSSHSEYPYVVARTVPSMRTYRPVPVMSRVCTPPVPLVVEKIVVQAAASGETWIWKARACAASQRSTTWLTAAEAPRSTWIHWGSLNALDQRVPVLPSTALAAGVPAFSVEEALTGRPWDSRVTAASARGGSASTDSATSAAVNTITMASRRRRRSYGANRRWS